MTQRRRQHRHLWPWLFLAAMLIVPYATLMTSIHSYFYELSRYTTADPYIVEKHRPCRSLCSCLSESISTRQQQQHEIDFSFLSPSSVWNLYKTDILNATFRRAELGNNESSSHLWQEYQRWIAYLFTEASSRRLLKSAQPSSFPSLEALKSVQSILQNQFKRKQRPLQVVVMGGSLTAGHGCQANPIGLPATAGILKRQVECAWPDRLQSLVNSLVGFEMVNITNVAMAATTSDVGATVVEYDLWPIDGGPDVIVSAFSTNDALAILSGDASSRQEVFDKMQTLMLQVQKRYSCATKKPLFVVVDDFNLWPGNLTEWLSFHQDLSTLVDWYHPNVWLINYYRSFSDYVYGDWKDGNVKGPWEWRPRKKLVRGEVHPGMAFHVTMAWTVAYNMLTLAMDTCAADLDDKAHYVVGGQEVLGNVNDKFKLPQLPNGPRPPITTELKTEHVSDLWRKETDNRDSKCRPRDGEMNETVMLPRCAFTWVANRLSDCPTSKKIQAKLEPVLSYNNGWRAEGGSYKSKHGWLALRDNATFGMKLSNIATDVRVITVLSMVSYGDKWQDSQLRMTVRGAENKETVSLLDISGVHNTETSVILPHKLKLPRLYERGSSMELDFQLVGGSTFKITGMAVCGDND